jgi:trimethylamine--corrinoid protein Co-methyltransferase
MTQPLHKYPVYELLDEEAIELIHAASLRILSEAGIAIHDEELLGILRAHGAVIEGEVVCFDPAMVEEYVAKAPGKFVQLARNPNNNVTIGGDHICFAPVYGPSHVSDLKDGRRAATLIDFQNFVKLAYKNPYIHHSGGTIVEPNDEPVGTRHLDMLFSHIKYSDKAFMGSVISADNATDSLAMVEILFGSKFKSHSPALLALLNINSPRQIDERTLGVLKVYARAHQALLITPFGLSGTTMTASIAGTVAQLNAEILACIVLIQMVRPGTPVIYGTLPAITDFRSGTPISGAPESQLSLYLSAQLARRYKLPFRSGGALSNSKIPDAQAGYESQMIMSPTIMAGTNFILHAAGWLEGGLVASYEKFVLDCELLGMFHKYLQGVDLSEEAFALESIRSVEPGGHHLSTKHTLRHYRTAFYQAEMFDYNPVEKWTTEGGLDSYQRANVTYKQRLKDYQAPALDASIEEALKDYVVRRKTQIGPD